MGALYGLWGFVQFVFGPLADSHARTIESVTRI